MTARPIAEQFHEAMQRAAWHFSGDVLPDARSYLVRWPPLSMRSEGIPERPKQRCLGRLAFHETGKPSTLAVEASEEALVRARIMDPAALRWADRARLSQIHHVLVGKLLAAATERVVLGGDRPPSDTQQRRSEEDQQQREEKRPSYLMHGTSSFR